MNTKIYSLDGLSAPDIPLASATNFLATPAIEPAPLPTLVNEPIVEIVPSVGEPDVPPQSGYAPLASVPLPAETDFYGQYHYCINAFPAMHEVVRHLSEELRKVDGMSEGWQKAEVLTNIFLLACSITDTLDDYLAGNTYDFSKIDRVLPPAAPACRVLNRCSEASRRVRAAWFGRLGRWRNQWAAAVTDFLQDSLAVTDPQPAGLRARCHELAALLPHDFPSSFSRRRAKIPAFFRSRDFAGPDCLELGRKLISCFPDSDRPALVVGLRTAGSFMAPLICAYLRATSRDADWVAIRPNKGLSTWERSSVVRGARKNARILIVDESIHSGQTLAKARELLRQAGFTDQDIVVLNPVEPAIPHWRNSQIFQSLSRIQIITLEPGERYKQRLLESDAVVKQLDEYFKARGYVQVDVVACAEGEHLKLPSERVDVRLKRVYAVHLTDSTGASETCYVLAKSVGWGWLGYHSFVAGQRLAEFVPPMLGLRDGILYSEWLPHKHDAAAADCDRKAVIESLASYVALRARVLRMENDPATDLSSEGRHKGLEILANTLSRAYGSRLVAALKRPQIQRQLVPHDCPNPTLTDSKMEPTEWIACGPKLLKVDFEHHGQGKNEMGMTDPAYDLASAIFHFQLSQVESADLVRKYVENSGDSGVEGRLLMNKLLVGTWAQNLATLGLHNPRLLSRRDEFHRQYISAWNFLVAETVRECGKLCSPPTQIQWRSPLVVADIDGVLDRMVFGFPSTSAAGIQAISLLHAHGFTIAINTARTLQEVKLYCKAYGFAGGVAEYGAVAWDAVTGRELVLVGPESMRELKLVANALRQIPGVFLNDDYQYSLRAFTYQNGRTSPLPPLLVQDLLAKLNVSRVKVHHTGLDSAVVAKETDKGAALLSFLPFVGLPSAEALAIGDSEPDLPMFRVARRAFAPGNVTCRQDAALIGCYIASSGYQPGLLEIARNIVHPDGSVCDQCRVAGETWDQHSGLFHSLLSVADQKPRSLLLRNCWKSSMMRIFKR